MYWCLVHVAVRDVYGKHTPQDKQTSRPGTLLTNFSLWTSQVSRFAVNKTVKLELQARRRFHFGVDAILGWVCGFSSLVQDDFLSTFFPLVKKKTSTCWILIYSFLVSKISGALVLGLKLRLLFLCWPFAGSFSILREGNENEQRALWLRGYCHGTRYSLASLSFVYEKATTTTDGRKSSYFDNHN